MKGRRYNSRELAMPKMLDMAVWANAYREVHFFSPPK